jgi:hypothetical protein
MATRDADLYLKNISYMKGDGYGHGYTRHVSAAAPSRCCRDGKDDPTFQVVWTIYRHNKQIGMFSPPPMRLRKRSCLCKTTFRDVARWTTTGYLHLSNDYNTRKRCRTVASTLRSEHGTSISSLIVHDYGHGLGNIGDCYDDIRASTVRCVIISGQMC